MLRISQLASAAAARAYYRHGDYYLDGQELPGVWLGRGAAMLGLSGEVGQAQFDRLTENRHPLTGDRLTARDRAGRRVGWDFNWHAPKGVSLAFELLRDERVLDAFRDAVGHAMAEVEADMQTRVRAGGAFEHRPVGNLAGAAFVHRTARPVGGVPDPHLHAHVVVFNAVRDPVEARWKAAETADLRRHSGYYAAVFNARLAGNMVALGYGVERKGKHWDVAHLPDELPAKFSRRTALIERVTQQAGITHPDSKAALGAKTRERKADHLTPAQLRVRWLARLTDAERYQLAHLPGQSAPLPTARQAAAWAIAHAFEREAVVPERRVYEHALRFGVGGVDPDGVRRECARQGLLVVDGQATTREMLALEAGLIAWARDGRGTRKPIGAPAARRLPEPIPGSKPSDRAPTLNPGQLAAVRHVLRSKDRVTLVRGAAGVGKTTALAVAADEIRAAGLPVRAIAPTGKAAEELRGVDPHADTLARFLVDRRMQGSVRGGWVILDELSLADTRSAAKLTQVLDALDARLLGVGDPRQHHAVVAGSPFALWTAHAGVEPAEVTEVVRQRGDYRRVSEHLGRHDTAAALDLLDEMGQVHECDAAERLNRIAGEYLAAVQRKQTVLVVAPTHAEAEEVTAAVRAKLKEDGRVTGDEREFLRLVPLNLTEAELRDGQRLEPGDVLQFQRSRGARKAGDRVAAGSVGAADRLRGPVSAYRPGAVGLAPGDAVRITAPGKDKSGRHKLRTGSVYQVKGFTRGGDILLGNGWVLAKDFGHLSHGYVSTSHASQGRTVDVVLVSESSRSFPAAGAEQLYVSLSRGRRAALLFTDDAAGLREAVRRSRANANATDLIPPTEERPQPVPRQARWMARYRQVMDKIKTQVSQLTKWKERAYERQAERG